MIDETCTSRSWPRWRLVISLLKRQARSLVHPRNEDLQKGVFTFAIRLADSRGVATPRIRSGISRAVSPSQSPAVEGLGTGGTANHHDQPPPPPPPLSPPPFRTGLNAETSFWNALGTVPRQSQHEPPVARASNDPPQASGTPYHPTNARPSVHRRLLPESPAHRHGYPIYPHNPNNVLDNILPRGLLYLIIDHFFDFIYPLNPVVHRPSFMKDVEDNREERQGEEEWVALVMVVVCVTIIQLPPTFLPISAEEARRIALTCFRYVKGFVSSDYQKLSLNRRESLVSEFRL